MPREAETGRGRVATLSLLFGLSLVLAEQPALAIGPGEGSISFGATRIGSLDVVIECENADTPIETISASATIEDTDTAADRASKIQAIIDAQTLVCLSSSTTANEISLTPCASCSVQSIAILNDSSGDSAIAIHPRAGEPVDGEVWFQGTPTTGGQTRVSIDVSDHVWTSGPGETTSTLMVGLVALLTGGGVDATFDGSRIAIDDDLDNLELGAGNDDTALQLNQRVSAFVVNPGEGSISFGATRAGSLDVVIECENADTSIETIHASAVIAPIDTASDRASIVQALIDDQASACLGTARIAHEITLLPCASCSVQSIAIENDSSGDSASAIHPRAGEPVGGEVWFQGTPTAGGQTRVSIDGTDYVSISDVGETTSDLMAELATLLTGGGVDATFDGSRITVGDDLGNRELGAGNDDTALQLSQRVFAVQAALAAVPALSRRGLVLLAILLVAGATRLLMNRRITSPRT